MPDREKVLTWLETCGKDNICSGNCPYSENGFGEYGRCRESLMADAYDLLKEQEAEIEQLNRFVNGFSRDAMPVVRCKDCKHGEPCKNMKGEDAIECFSLEVSLEVKCRNPNWFCGDGESKKD